MINLQVVFIRYIGCFFVIKTLSHFIRCAEKSGSGGYLNGIAELENMFSLQ